MKIYGSGLDAAGRCVHWHGDADVVALRCGQCHRYYACYMCHDAMEDHGFRAADDSDETPVLCGSCMHQLTREQYAAGSCAYCGHGFNPGCALHHDIYFAKQERNSGFGSENGKNNEV